MNVYLDTYQKSSASDFGDCSIGPMVDEVVPKHHHLFLALVNIDEFAEFLQSIG